MSKPSYYVPNTINKASLDEVKEVLKKLSEILDSSFSIFIQFRTWGEEKERQSDLLILTKNGIYNLEVKNYREVIKICYPGEWVVTNNKKVKNPLKQSEDTADNVQKYLQEKADKIFSEKRKQELFKRILKVFPLLLLLTPSGSVNKNKISSRCILLNGINDLENYFKKNRATWHLYEGNSLT
ncbi:MAG: nuclease-related domain-containing protein, partial [Candidatus Kryptonium sp.]